MQKVVVETLVQIHKIRAGLEMDDLAGHLTHAITGRNESITL